ncbi:MAG: type IV toxin-antitoxin system AbiEi family antitoxin [Oligosphaeraceae bacterium]
MPKLKAVRYSGELAAIDGGEDLVASGETAARKEKILSTGHVLLWNQGNGVARTAARNHWHLVQDGNIEVREAFWPVEKRRFATQVPWLLVYADLLAAEDGRCLEAAEEIRKRHLEGIA